MAEEVHWKRKIFTLGIGRNVRQSEGGMFANVDLE